MSLEIRQFNLINSKREIYTLTIPDKYTGFMTTADGLGYEKSPEYQKIGNEFTQLTSSINQSVITGVIQFFQPHAYQNFTAFAAFCQDDDLTLYYRTPTGEFKKKGSVTKIDKSEGTDSLKVRITFTAETLWFNEIHRATSGGYTQDNVTWSVVSVNSDSLIESPCHIWASVPQGQTLTEVEWRYFHNPADAYSDDYDINGVLSDITLEPGDTLHIRTDTNPYRIYKTDSNGVETDLYAKSDFSTKRFINLQKGINLVKFRGNFLSQGIEGRILHETV